LKPWGILDKWGENRTNTGTASDGVWHSGEGTDTPISTYDRYYAPTGSPIALLSTPPALDFYTAPTSAGNLVTSFVARPPSAGGDLGRQLALTVGKQNDRPPALGNPDNPFAGGWFIPVSPDGGNTVDYKDAITGCVD
jgi:hypothetical protein